MQQGTQSGLRDKLIAALLVGAVVVVIGYASGLGVRQGGTPAAAAQQPPAAAPAPATPLPAVPPPPPPAAAAVGPVNSAPPPAVTATVEPHVHDPSHHHGDGSGDQPPSGSPSEPEPTDPPEDCEEDKGLLESLMDLLKWPLPIIRELLGETAPDEDEDAAATSCERDETEPEHTHARTGG